MQHRMKGPYERYIKRPLDCLAAACVLIVLSPTLLVVAILVRIKLGAPVLFKQTRPGKDEKLFTLYKFRTMTDRRDDDGKLLPDAERLTRFGAALRSSSLDELPELLNILRGDMSFVGPRPLLVQYLPYYSETERHRHDVLPGLTGLAQVNGRNALGWDQRLAFDVEYVNGITFRGDIRILLRTVKKVLIRENVAADTAAVEAYLNEERKALRAAEANEAESPAGAEAPGRDLIAP